MFDLVFIWLFSRLISLNYYHTMFSTTCSLIIKLLYNKALKRSEECFMCES